MKKIIQSLAIAPIIITSLLTAGNIKAQSVEAAKENVKESKEQLKQAQLNAAYPAFKKNAENKIAENESHIDNLKAKLAEPGKSPLDDMRRQKIEDLRKQNADLRAELYGYEKERSDWETFKAKFNHDADKLGKAFTDFGNDLKKN
jgi:DNA repair exonuclease SbcCD ATPase subunit